MVDTVVDLACAVVDKVSVEIVEEDSEDVTVVTEESVLNVVIVESVVDTVELSLAAVVVADDSVDTSVDVAEISVEVVEASMDVVEPSADEDEYSVEVAVEASLDVAVVGSSLELVGASLDVADVVGSAVTPIKTVPADILTGSMVEVKVETVVVVCVR